MSSVVLLRSLTGDELDAARNGAFLRVLYEQVNVIGSDHVIQHTQPESLPRFVEPAQVVVSITGKPEEKVSLVAAMSQVPDMAGQEMAIGTRHRFAPVASAAWREPGISTTFLLLCGLNDSVHQRAAVCASGATVGWASCVQASTISKVRRLLHS